MQSVGRYLIALLFMTSLTRGQERLEVGGFLGGAGYLGDLNKSDWASKEPKAALGLLARYNLSDHVAVRASFLYGHLSGRDRHYPDRAFRNFTTLSSVNELTLQAEWHLWPLTQPHLPHFFKPTFSPFLFVGFGIAITYPKADMEHMIVAKPEFVTGAEMDRNAVYSPFHGAIPFGAGISFAANPNKSDRYQFWGATVAYRFRRLPYGLKIRRAVKCKVWLE
jgi:hypothetical protein